MGQFSKLGKNKETVTFRSDCLLTAYQHCRNYKLRVVQVTVTTEGDSHLARHQGQEELRAGVDREVQRFGQVALGIFGIDDNAIVTEFA